MKKAFLFTLTLMSSFYCYAGPQWSQPGHITYISLAESNEHVYIQLSSPKVNSCQGRFYMLKLVNNPMGNSMFSMLLAHKATQEKLMVYTTGNCLTSYQNPEITILKTEGDNTSY